MELIKNQNTQNGNLLDGSGLATCKYLNRYIFILGGSSTKNIVLFDTLTNGLNTVAQLQQPRLVM